MRPIICAGCKREFKIKKTGVVVVYLSLLGEPVELTHADLYACPECDTEIITGFGKGSIYSPDERFNPMIKDAEEKDILYKI